MIDQLAGLSDLARVLPALTANVDGCAVLRMGQHFVRICNVSRVGVGRG